MNKIIIFLLVLPFASLGKNYSHPIDNDSTQAISPITESISINDESNPTKSTSSRIKIETFSSDSQSFLIKGVSKTENLQLIDLAGRKVFFDSKIEGDKMVITPHHINNIKENFILFINDQKGNTLVKRVDML